LTEPTLPPAPDDSDEGWGTAASAADDDAENLRRLLAERPPHHDR
jgi:hypothetical protein